VILRELPFQLQLPEKAAYARSAALFSTEKPLLLSVRSGARVSMPGMMDTVLNLGLNDVTVEAVARDCPAMSALPATATAASSRCMAMWSWASITSCSRMRSGGQGQARRS
jgi:hypothetical protein